MIRIVITKSNQRIYSIEVSGHSGYEKEGKDIVCSAVSSLTQSLINGLVDEVGIKNCYTIDESTPYLKVELPNGLDEVKLHDAGLLMKTTVNALKNISKDYSKFINIKEK